MKRYEHIDISKGIGILLVVFFHLPGVNRLIYFNNLGGGGGLQPFICHYSLP